MPSEYPPQAALATMGEGSDRDSTRRTPGGFSTDDANAGYPMDDDDSQSFISLESNLTSPTYVSSAGSSYDFFGASVTTLTNPPQYTSAIVTSHGVGEDLKYGREFAFDIVQGGSKSKQKWATLHLKEAQNYPSNGKYPRISGSDGRIIGKVEIPPTSSQPFTTIKLVLKGLLQRPNNNVEALERPVKILNQTYTLWDRKNGESQPPGEVPFSIPFPTHVKLSTLAAVDNTQNEASPSSPLRSGPLISENGLTDNEYPPEKKEKCESRYYQDDTANTPITPFHVDGIPAGLIKTGPSENTALPFLYDAVPLTQAETRPLSPQKRRSKWSLLPVPFSKKSGPLHDGAHGPGSSSSGRVTAGSRGGSGNNENKTHGRSGLKSSIEMAEELPPSFVERGVPVGIRYELTLLITHGRFSTDSKAETPIIYTPNISRSLPMPLTRQLVYQMPLGPDLDPDAWKKLSSVPMHGTFLGKQGLTAEYTLYLANPLSYLWGTVIPCYMTVTCDEEDLLDLLASPQTPNVSLHRLMYTPGLKEASDRSVHLTAYNPHTGHSTAMPGEVRLSAFDLVTMQGGGKKRPSSAGASEGLPHIEGKVETHPSLPEAEAEETRCSDALWWVDRTSEERVQQQRPGIKALRGEIRLPRGLYPTCMFPLFMVWYRVDLHAPTLSAFIPDDLKTPRDLKGKGTTKGRDSHDWNEVGAYASQVVEIITNCEGRRVTTG